MPFRPEDSDTAWARSHNHVAVFAAEDDDVNPANGKSIAQAPPFTIVDDHQKRGFGSTLYLQDQWKTSERMTLNFGGRVDHVSAYVHEGQFSPRLSAVFQPLRGTMLHAGYARYFIPPPLENVSPTSVEKFFGTTTHSPDVATDDLVKCEYSHYFDVGLTHGFSPEFTVGIDAYLKRATNQIDDGPFGAANIFSPYNFAEGKTSGVEVSASYVRLGFSSYANLAVSQARRRHIVSSQFQFEQEELDYLATHEVYSDQNQFFTGSADLAFERGPLTFHADIIYGSGMRSGFANRGTLPAYYPANVGLEYRWRTSGRTQVRARADIINVFDQSYVLNDGTGIGVGAPRYGARRGFFGGVSCEF